MAEEYTSTEEVGTEGKRNVPSFASGFSSAAGAAAAQLKHRAERVYISVVEEKLLKGVDMKDKKNRGGMACSICCTVCGSLSLLLSACTYFIITAVFVWAILDNAVITSEHCIGYNFWMSNIGGVSPPEYECFHMFNLTNLETVQAGGMAVYDEVGPYCYVIQKEKFNVEWEDDEHTVSHQTWQYYVYSPKMSVGDPDEDIIVNLSPGYLGIVMVLHGEELLPIVMTGTIIGTNVEWLTTVFVHHMQSNTTATLLPQQQQSILSDGIPLDEFYYTWANATTAPSAEWQGMLVSFEGEESGIPLAAAQLLWDEDVPYSLTNLTKESIAGWFNASLSSLPEGDFTNGNYVNSTEDSWSFLASEFGITVKQVQMIGTWLRESFFITYTNPALVSTYAALDDGVQEVRDLGWLQWGACNVVSQELKLSANEAFYFYPGGKPEYGCSDPLAPPLSVAQSKERGILTLGQLLMGSAGVVSLPGLVEFVVVYADASVSCADGSITANLTDCTGCSTCDSLSCLPAYVGGAHVCEPCSSYTGTCTENPLFEQCTVTSGNGTCVYDSGNNTCNGAANTTCALSDPTGACTSTGGVECNYLAGDGNWTCAVVQPTCSFDNTTQACTSTNGCTSCAPNPYTDPNYASCSFNVSSGVCVSTSSNFTCSLSAAPISCAGSVTCERCAVGSSSGNGTESQDAAYCSQCSCSSYSTANIEFPACMECSSCSNYTLCNDTAIWEDFSDEWGLTKSEADYFFAYLGIIVLDYGDQELDRVLNANGGLFKTMSVNDWLYHPEDPLMRIVEPYFPIDGRLVVNTTSKQEAEDTIPPSKLYTGKGNLDNLNRYITFRNMTEVTYAVDIPVAGQDEWGQFQPFQQARGIDHLYMFDPNYMRELEIVKMMEVEYRGVELYRYSFSNTTWAPNPDYFMTIPGFTNQTIIEGSPIFLSIAHWQGVPDEYSSKVKGVVEGRDWRTDYSVIDIEPHTGLVFHTNASLMVNLYLEPHMSDWLSVYNPNVTVDTFYPVMWALEQALFSKEDAMEYNLLVGFMLWLQKVLVGFYLAAGLVMLVCAYMLWKWVRDIRETKWQRVDYDVQGDYSEGEEETERFLASLED